MHGVVEAKSYPADSNNLDQKILFYWAVPRTEGRSQGWTTLAPQASFWGPEISFGRELSRNHPERQIALLKFSLGSTSLGNDWKGRGKGGLYDQLIQEYAQAIESMPKSLCPKAFVWIQGESDAETPELANEYQQRLQTLIEDVRQNLANSPNLPVILGLDEQHPWVIKNPQVITAQEEIAAADPNIIRVSMIGLEKLDSTHLNTSGLIGHGKRIAAAIESMEPVQCK